MRRSSWDAKSLTIAARLREWDFLGVYADPESRPEDDEEYDDLVHPLREWLERGADAASLSRHLCAHLEKTYGVSPASPLAVMGFTGPLYNWWGSVA